MAKEWGLTGVPGGEEKNNEARTGTTFEVMTNTFFKTEKKIPNRTHESQWILSRWIKWNAYKEIAL